MFNSRERKKKKEFEIIYDENIQKVFRFVYLKVSSKDDAEDITSKVFTKLWDSLKGGEEIKNPRAFAYKIARNMVIDYYRKNREKDSSESFAKSKKIPLEEVVVLDKEMRADERALFESQIEEVTKALKSINEDYQNVIIWYYLDELTVQEIAVLLDKPEASVRVLVHRALAALKKSLEEKKEV